MKRLKLFRSRLATYGACSAVVVIFIGIIGPHLAPYGTLESTNDLLHPPSLKYLLGTDSYGQDLFSRILRGCRITLTLAGTTVFFAALFGVLWGLLAAYTRGKAGIVFNRSIDVAMSFPSIMTALLVLAIVGTAGRLALIVAIAFALTPRFARVIHGSTLPILEEDFILAEKALGAGHFRILVMHVLPNLVAQITVLVSIYLPFVIMLESTLSFLGLGAPPNVPTWGRIIADGKHFMQTAPWLTIFPGIAIIIAALSFNLLGDGLRDLFDPRSATRLYRQ